MTYRFGAHLSSYGSYEVLFEKLRKIGGNCLQLFAANPRMWKPAEISKENAEHFRALKKKWDVDPIYFHASYLVNLADKGATGNRSQGILIRELKIAEQMGIKGTILHTGSFKTADPDYPFLIKRIKALLEKTPKDTLFIIENSGNRKIGLKLEEIGKILELVNNERVRVCLDTCHLHSAGYNLRTEETFDMFLKEVEKTIGWDRVEVWHINDSRDPFGSFRDRHENLGEGSVGKSVFTFLLNNKKTNLLPFILEVPGFDGEGPDKKNLDILKSFVNAKK